MTVTALMKKKNSIPLNFFYSKFYNQKLKNYVLNYTISNIKQNSRIKKLEQYIMNYITWNIKIIFQILQSKGYFQNLGYISLINYIYIYNVIFYVNKFI